MAGGYDFGYEATRCLWGDDPGRLIRTLSERLGTFVDLDVLDAGCGEGKNSAFLVQRGANAVAIDISSAALRNGRQRWGTRSRIRWVHGDARTDRVLDREYDVVIAYGLLHCIRGAAGVSRLLRRLQHATRERGYLALCAFNDRSQDLSGHPPDFKPTLLPHRWYASRFDTWEIISCTDEDIREVHPPLNVPHHHSLTRILARRGSA